MGRQYEKLDGSLIEWITGQHIFFVGTAPTDVNGLVNLSPKGAMDTFRILGPTSVAYLDLVGSGIETVAHIRENGRITLMFCAFEGPPKVLRLHGQGRVVQPQDPDFKTLLEHFTVTEALQSTLRSVITIEVARISDSCGFVVPHMEFVEERQQLFRWADHQHKRHGDGWTRKFKQANNRVSVDGLTGLDLLEALPDEDLRKHSSEGRAL